MKFRISLGPHAFGGKGPEIAKDIKFKGNLDVMVDLEIFETDDLLANQDLRTVRAARALKAAEQARSQGTPLLPCEVQRLLAISNDALLKMRKESKQLDDALATIKERHSHPILNDLKDAYENFAPSESSINRLESLILAYKNEFEDAKQKGWPIPDEKKSAYNNKMSQLRRLKAKLRQ